MHRTISQLPRRPRESNSARRLAAVRATGTTGTLLGDTRSKLALSLHRKTEGSVAASITQVRDSEPCSCEPGHR